MKDFTFKVIFKNGEEKKITVNAENVLDGHYRIYRTYGRTYSKSILVN